DAAQHPVELLDQELDIVAFIEGRHHDAQFQPARCRRNRGFGAHRVAEIGGAGDRDHANSRAEQTGLRPLCQGWRGAPALRSGRWRVIAPYMPQLHDLAWLIVTWALGLVLADAGSAIIGRRAGVEYRIV